jgi:hypothetical protein
MRSDFLRPLSDEYLRTLLTKLPKKGDQKEKSEGETFRNLWRPLSRIPLPSSTRPKQRKTAKPDMEVRRYLVMEVLHETRSTQMQVPIPVVEGFFGVGKRQPLNLELSILTRAGLSQAIDRPLVLSQGHEGQRLMRRVEMPQIRNLPRPLVVLFIKLAGRGCFAFKLLPQRSAGFRVATRLLAQEGQQGGARRRFLFGRPRDAYWRIVKQLLLQ